MVSLTHTLQQVLAGVRRSESSLRFFPQLTKRFISKMNMIQLEKEGGVQDKQN